jgi:clan AA aspartic protease (TIGR02281 family)
MKLIKWMSIVLSVSLGANFFFLYKWYINNASMPQFNNQANTQTNKSKPASTNTHAWQIPNNDTMQNTSIKSQPSDAPIFSNEADPEITKQEYFAWLEALAKAQLFEKLEFEVRAYLRLYPQDINAQLLEAQAYYHNKPLNIALVHYHELLTKPLSKQQQTEVEKLIAVNTTRIIQQFSSDRAWDLLAAFLEPLVQIAPSNRQYLMALARAYGMQSQFTLMEDVLASFPADDIRSARLRENVTAKLNQGQVGEQLATLPMNIEPTEFNERGVADVLLQQERGQFVTSASVHNTKVNLLVDTGASTSALSDEKFNDLDASETEFLGVFNINTAGGTIQAPIYKVSRITIGQKTLLNTSFLILPSDNLGRYDGLLGMNVLSQFDMVYDAASETMRLYKKR